MARYFAAHSDLQRTQARISAPFRQEFFTPRYGHKHETEVERQWFAERMAPPRILSIEATPQAATVIFQATAGPRVRDRRKFELVLTDQGWRIEQKGEACFDCQGETGLACTWCAGTGWKMHD